jgi:hypothetical protein
MWLRMTASRVHSPSAGICTPPRVIKSNTIFATFSAPTAKRGKRPHKKGIVPAEDSGVPPYVFVPDRELDFLTDSYVKLVSFLIGNNLLRIVIIKYLLIMMKTP